MKEKDIHRLKDVPRISMWKVAFEPEYPETHSIAISIPALFPLANRRDYERDCEISHNCFCEQRWYRDNTPFASKWMQRAFLMKGKRYEQRISKDL